MLANFQKRVKLFWEDYRSDVILGVGLVLIILLSFAAGRLSVQFGPKPEIRVEELTASTIKAKQTSETGEYIKATTGVVVGSKNSNKYHLPHCPGAKRIKEQNKIWFSSIEEARQAGYEPAANCPGLQ